MTLLVPIEPAVLSNPYTFSANSCLLCWLFTPFLCNWLFLPTHRPLQLSLSGCRYPLLTQTTHSVPAELQTNTALSTEPWSGQPRLFRKHLIFLLSDPLSIKDKCCHGCWPVTMTERVSPGAPYAARGGQVLWGKVPASPYPTSQPSAPELWNMTGRSKVSHFSKENKHLFYFWLTVPENKKPYKLFTIWWKYNYFPFFCWTCDATSADIYGVLQGIRAYSKDSFFWHV